VRIHHVQIMIPAGREDEARGYYQGLLGFRPLERPATQPRPGLWFRAGTAELHLGLQAGGPAAESRAHVAFTVPGAEFDRLREAILGADFEVREAAPGAGGRRFHTRDPFGNRLEFMEDLKNDRHE
jgi:catechol 2,3-dioxygenase-like lactoylglutathione lyase family enzyme